MTTFISAALLAVCCHAVVVAGDARPSGAQVTDGVQVPDEAAGPGGNEKRAVAVIEVDGRLEVRVGEADTLGEFIGFAGEAAMAGELLGVDMDGTAVAAVGPDEYRDRQWGLDRVDLEQLHGVVDGTGVTIAVIDSGVRTTHEDFAGSVGEGSDCYDPAVSVPWICDRNADPVADHYHGSHVAGIAAARRDNDHGIVGVAPGVTVVPIRVLALNASGGVSGPFAAIAAGVGEAVALGADVINLSVQATVDNEALAAAIRFAQDSGVVVVAAAGNKAFEGDPPVYPGAYDGVVTVANLASSDLLAGSSSTGPAIDLAAPGSSIYSLGGSTDDAYRFATGTSMASPFVAGAVALLLQAEPGLTLAEIESYLYSTAEDMGPAGRDDGFGFGLVDPVAAFGAMARDQLLAPLGVSADRRPGGSVQLAWSRYPGPTGWRVTRNGQRIASLAPSVESFTDDSALTTVASTYAVEAVYAGGVADSQVEVGPSEPPNPPVNLEGVPSDTSIELTWEGAAAAGAAAADAFEVTWSPGGGFRGVSGTTTTIGGLDPDSTYRIAVRARNEVGLSAPTEIEVSTLSARAGPRASGYWMLDAAGITYPFGDALLFDHGAPTVADAVAIASDATGRGIWVLHSGGRVEVHGTATHYGQVPPSMLAPGEYPSALSVLPDGSGYWLFTNRGRAAAFGAASHHGDLLALQLNAEIVDSQATISGRGYWMLGADGGVFAFGDAEFRGSTGGMALNEPVVGMAPDVDGDGYWLVASDGGVFSFAAPFYGSMGGIPLNRPVNGMVQAGNGYLMVASDGGVFAFGPAVEFHGSLADQTLQHPIVAITPL